jgi:hypothetical protein
MLETLRRFSRRAAGAVLMGWLALYLVSPASATRVFDWALRIEMAQINKRIQPVMQAPFAAAQRTQAEAFRREQQAAQARAMARARKKH